MQVGPHGCKGAVCERRAGVHAQLLQLRAASGGGLKASVRHLGTPAGARSPEVPAHAGAGLGGLQGWCAQQQHFQAHQVRGSQAPLRASWRLKPDPIAQPETRILPA